MTAYTVFMRYRNASRPTQQPGQSVQNTDDNNMTYASAQVNTADTTSAWTAGLAAFASSWATTENARYSGTQSQEELPGGVPTYTAADAPKVMDGIVVAGTLTIAGSFLANYAGSPGAQPFVNN